ncbi:Uncharacterised protein [Mycobacterium tuberculosis]|uniref:Uncharacterized protein n=1 Tax=Mycobacterium tuberculosis TaxID=1773 RepID=A0A655AVJ3_MYCTX|nr:Uncharacterised protein [Mycobacterium tuberculosis]CKS21412.1 Uncharacterised protein [Mycobacterium tuberculosis]CKU11524.1 Uncharacterised protein [Mycobacterium tuberculosis]COW69676.1 Uncharacterised protein [Mycobacterium tuberculosis]CPA43198.1 Uncharacterised protein [Mycobacterium tuberculosis]
MELAVGQHGGRGEVISQAQPGQRPRLGAGELAVGDHGVDEVAELEIGQLGGHLEHLLARGEVTADLQRVGRGVVAVQHGVTEVDALVDAYSVHLGEPAGQFAGQVAVVHPHLGREVFGRGVQRM